MKHGILSIVLTTAFAAAPAISSAEVATAPATQPITQPATQPAMHQAMIMLRQAKDPSNAIDAYSAGLTIDPSYVELKKLYVQKMVELESPESATSQAHQVLIVDPNHAMSLAVVAHDNAKRGNVTEGLRLIVRAGRNSPDIPFIQRSAAQMLAWYDNQQSKPTVDDLTRLGIEDLRRNLANRPAFADAYKEANEFYKNATAQAKPQQPQQPQQVTQPVTATDMGYVRPEVIYEPAYTYSYPYRDPYYYYNPYPVYYTPATVVFLDNCHASWKHRNHCHVSSFHHGKSFHRGSGFWYDGCDRSVGSVKSVGRTGFINKTAVIAGSSTPRITTAGKFAGPSNWKNDLPTIRRPAPLNRSISGLSTQPRQLAQPRNDMLNRTLVPPTAPRISSPTTPRIASPQPTPARQPSMQPRISASNQRWNAPRSPGPSFRTSSMGSSSSGSRGR